jgi:hypothetical protein
MRRVIVCLIAGLIAISPGIAAQDVIYPGSTVDGDYLRGQGIFLKGAAWFEIEAAKARALDAQTQMLVDRYLHELHDTYQAERMARYKLRGARTKAAAKAMERERAAREARLRTAPNDVDLASGDAINALLADLSDPAVNLWSLSLPEVPLPDGISIPKLAFQFIPKAMTGKDAKPLSRCLIALGKLDKKGGWPAYMMDEVLRDERLAYDLAYRNLIDSCVGSSDRRPSMRSTMPSIRSAKRPPCYRRNAISSGRHYAMSRR